jgi:hypothetical protein
MLPAAMAASVFLQEVYTGNYWTDLEAGKWFDWDKTMWPAVTTIRKNPSQLIPAVSNETWAFDTQHSKEQQG